MTTKAPKSKKKEAPAVIERPRMTDEELQTLCPVIYPTPATKEDFKRVYQEVVNTSFVHGPVVGAVVEINDSFLQETTFYYADGFTSFTDVPAIGININDRPEFSFNVLLMNKIVSSISGLADAVGGDYLSQRGSLDEIDACRRAGQNACFIFRASEALNAGVDFSRCLGNFYLEAAIQKLAIDPKTKIMPEVGLA